MKKAFSHFAFLSLALQTLIAPVFAEVILAPQWSEFAPTSYQNAEASKFSTNKTYWYNRRVQFNDSIAKCSAYTDEDLKSCYSQVREAELSKNKIWNAKIQAEQENLDSLRQYNNTQDVFYSINKLIDKIK